MRKGLTEIVFILDRSGSMRGLEADTIGGFNSMIERQQKEEGEAFLSTILFDDETEVLYDRVPLDKVEPMYDRQYYVRGCTALLDAVGGAIHHIGNVHKYARPDDVPEKTLFIITTDGMENASRRYDYRRVKEMVERQQKKYNWEFIFVGANIDAISVAGKFGVSASRAVRFENDGMGAELNYKVMSDMVSCARSAKSARRMSEVFESGAMLSEIRADYEEYEECAASDAEVDFDEDDREAIEGIFSKLSSREQSIAKAIFGLGGEIAHTVPETSRMVNLQEGRVRQMAEKIKRKAGR